MEYTNPPLWWIGVDLGQSADYSAISVMRITGTGTLIENPKGIIARAMAGELDYFHVQTDPIHIDLVHCERLPLGTPYPGVVKRVHDVQKRLNEPSVLVVDATGVGRPVLDMMDDLGLSPIGVNITGGSTVTPPAEGYKVPIFGVPKRDLVAVLVVALQNHRLRIAAGLPFGAALVHELQNFKVSISASGHDSYAAWREADHDDLVLSMAVAAWLADLRYKNTAPTDFILTIDDLDDDWAPELISRY